MRDLVRLCLCLLLALDAAWADDPAAAAVLAEINLARTQPQTYAQILAADLSRTRSASVRSATQEAIRHLERMAPVPPLQESAGLTAAAALHVAQSGPPGTRGHRGAGFSSPWSRMDRYGRRSGTGAENICYGTRSARAIVITQLVDAGVRSRGHRKNLLNPALAVAGVAVGPHAGYGTMCVIDFAAFFVEHPPRGRPLAAQ